MEDLQKEIDRLAEDNRQYRDRFLFVLDKHFDYQKPDNHSGHKDNHSEHKDNLLPKSSSKAIEPPKNEKVARQPVKRQRKPKK